MEKVREGGARSEFCVCVVVLLFVLDSMIIIRVGGLRWGDSIFVSYEDFLGVRFWRYYLYFFLVFFLGFLWFVSFG